MLQILISIKRFYEIMNLETWIAKENLTVGEFADCIGLTSAMVSRWFVGDSPVGTSYIWKIYDLTNGEVLPSDLRPDLYPTEPLKRIYGCVRCREKPPENYKDWFHSLEEAAIKKRRYGHNALQEEKLAKIRKQREKNV